MDGLRVIAAFAVLVIHVGGETGVAFNGSPLSWLVSRGDVGVPIFFTLSGLLLYRPWAAAALSTNDNPPAVPYLWRRALRILPAYWAVVLVAFVTLNHVAVHKILDWVQYLALAQVYDPHPWWSGTGAPGLAQMWSLAVEVSFYAVLPLLGCFLTWWARRVGPDVGRRARRLLMGLAVLTVVSLALGTFEFYPTFQPLVGETLPRLMAWFTPGMAIAVLVAWAETEPDPDSPIRRLTGAIAQSAGACMVIAALVFIVACTPVTGPETISIVGLWAAQIKLVLYAIIAAAIVAPAAFQPRRQTRLSIALGNRVMRFLGKISYGIFLWQYIAIYGFFAVLHLRNAFEGGYFSTISSIGVLIAITVLMVVLATVSFYLIENPALKLSRRGRSRKPAISSSSRPASHAARSGLSPDISQLPATLTEARERLVRSHERHET